MPETQKGLLQTIEDDFVRVERFISGIVTAILPVVTIINPTLAGEAKLAVDVLNALASNTSNMATQADLSTAIAAIVANPTIANTVLSKINLAAVGTAIADVNVAIKAVGDVQAVVSGTPKAQVEVQVSTPPLTEPAADGGGN